MVDLNSGDHVVDSKNWHALISSIYAKECEVECTWATVERKDGRAKYGGKSEKARYFDKIRAKLVCGASGQGERAKVLIKGDRNSIT